MRTLVGSGTGTARMLTLARILLKANQGEGGPGWTDAAIAGALEVGRATVARVRQTYATVGLEAALAREVAAWEERRNTTPCTINWRFTTADARIKLKHLYPSFQE